MTGDRPLSDVTDSPRSLPEPAGGEREAPEARPRLAWPGASTFAAGLVGWPVEHSLSPLLHNVAFAAAGLDGVYLAFAVPESSFPAAVHGAAALGLRGLSVTMPHKEAAARIASRRSPLARRLGSANTLLLGASGIVAESTDGAGLLDDLRDNLGFDPSGRRCGVIGAGGAARAAVVALAGAGAAEIIVVNRTPASAWKAASLAPRRARVGRGDELAAVDLVIQTTPGEMSSPPPVRDQPRLQAGFVPVPISGRQLLPAARGSVAGVDPGRFGAGQLVVDVIYDPAETDFLHQARKSGARVRNGLGMLVHQAGHQFRLFTGLAPPLEAMWKAVPGSQS